MVQYPYILDTYNNISAAALCIQIPIELMELGMYGTCTAGRLPSICMHTAAPRPTDIGRLVVAALCNGVYVLNDLRPSDVPFFF